MERCLPAAAGRGRGEQGEIVSHALFLAALYDRDFTMMFSLKIYDTHKSAGQTTGLPHGGPCSPRPRQRGTLHV
jgi:hypothetical protein